MPKYIANGDFTIKQIITHTLKLLYNYFAF
jgi:hypothetical protein